MPEPLQRNPLFGNRRFRPPPGSGCGACVIDRYGLIGFRQGAGRQPRQGVSSTVPVKAGKMPVSSGAARKKTALVGTARPALRRLWPNRSRRARKNAKVVRDSFSMPKSEHARLKVLRSDLARAGRICSKSELLRAGLELVSLARSKAW